MQLAYVVLTIAGVTLQAPDPIPMVECTSIVEQAPAALCVGVEAPCGIGEAELCLDQPKAKVAKKRTVRRRR